MYQDIYNCICQNTQKKIRKSRWDGRWLKNVPSGRLILIAFRISTASWWRHKMENFSALLALCAGNSPVTGEFPSQRPVTLSSGVLFDLRLNKRLSKQSRRLWFETPSCSLLRHCNDFLMTWWHNDQLVAILVVFLFRSSHRRCAAPS